MDTDETQIKTAEKDFSLQPVTEQIIGAAFEVHNVLGFGFLEKVYQRAMQAELQLRGVKVELEPKNSSSIQRRHCWRLRCGFVGG